MSTILTRRPIARRLRLTLPLLQVYFVWLLTLIEVHYLLGFYVASAFMKLVHLGYPVLLALVILRLPMLLGRERWRLFPPLLAFLGICLATLPFAINVGFARLSLTYLLMFYTVNVGTAVFVRTPQEAWPIMLLFVGQFAFFGLFAGAGAHVMWHPTLANDDGYAALMVQGVGVAFWFAYGARPRALSLALYLLAAFCVYAVIVTQARGAFLSLVAVCALIWLRSPRKVAATGVLAVGGLLVAAGAAMTLDVNAFWAEIMSSFQEGTSEGTGAQRWELWTAALQVFIERPIFGVGGGNFGAFAASYIRDGEFAMFPRASMFYGFNLHNAFFQILVEFGAVGILCLVWILWDFWSKNTEMLSPEAGRRWATATGDRVELRALARALEAANVANLLSGIFYASLFMPWLWLTWAANRMFWAVVRAPRTRSRRRPLRSSQPPESIAMAADPEALPLSPVASPMR